MNYAAFLDAIEAVCREHGISIAHEDHQGAFILRPLGEGDIAWLRDATQEEEMPF